MAATCWTDLSNDLEDLAKLGRLARNRVLARNLDAPLDGWHIGKIARLAPRAHDSLLFSQGHERLARKYGADLARPKEVEVAVILAAELPESDLAIRIHIVLRQDIAEVPVAAASLRERRHGLPFEVGPILDLRPGDEEDRKGTVQRAADNADAPAGPLWP